MKSRSIFKLMNKRGVTMIAAAAIALSTAGAVAPTVAYADETVVESPVESTQENVKDFNDGSYLQNKLGYSIKSVNTDSTAVKAYDYELSKTLSDNSTVCLKGNTLVKYDTKGTLLWEKQLDSKICYSTPTYNNLLVDSKDNIIVLGYYAGETNGIYDVYDVNGNRTEFKYGTYVPVPEFEDSVTFDADENLIYQEVESNTYYVYDRAAHNYSVGNLLETDHHFYFNGSKVVSTNDGCRVIVGYAKYDNDSRAGYSYSPLLIKINNENKVVFNVLYTNGVPSGVGTSQAGFAPKIYKSADGGLFVNDKRTRIYYKIDKTTGQETQIQTYGTVWGFKAIDGVDYMYGKMGKTSLGDMASNIATSSVDYIIPVGEDLTKGIFFNGDFGTIKDIVKDVDNNNEVLFSCKSNNIVNNEDGSAKIISATLTK